MARMPGLLSLVIVGALAGPASAETPVSALEAFQAALFQEAAPSVVMIGSGKAMGSGFFVTDKGHVLTNRHVVQGAKVVDVLTFGGTSHKGRVVELADKDLDLALVKIDVVGSPALQMAPLANLQIGSWVASIGHGAGGTWTFTTGMISNIYPLGDGKPIIQTQLPLNPGNSGGPVLDKHGRVVAIVTAGIRAANAVNFSIRIDMAYSHLSQLAAQCDCLVIKASEATLVYVNGELMGRGRRVVPVTAGEHKVAGVRGSRGLERLVRFPEARTVDLLDLVSTKTDGQPTTNRRLARQRTSLDLDVPTEHVAVPDILPYWVGKRVHLERRDGKVAEVELTGFRPPATIMIRADNGRRLTLDLGEIRKIRRL